MAKSSRVIAIGALAVGLLATLALSGCWWVTGQAGTGSTTTGSTPATIAVGTDATTAVDPTSTAGTEVPDNGMISRPFNPSPKRKALLDSARAKLGTSSSIYVNQLWAQGNQAAIGDVTEQSGSGKRLFVVWIGPKWQAVWTEAVGNGPSTMQRALHAVPELTSELANKIDWGVVAAPPKASAKDSLSTAAKGWTDQLMSGKGKPYQVDMARTAQSADGVTWGRVVIQPTGNATNQYESIEYWAKYRNDVWTGKAQDPEPPAPTTYFPKSVVGTLFQ